MLNKRKAMLSILMMACLSGNAFAQKGKSSSIDYIQTASNGNIFIAFENSAMPSCYENRGGLLSRETQEGYKSMYSLLLAAKMADKVVTPIYEVVGSNQSQWGRCQIKAVFLGLDAD